MPEDGEEQKSEQDRAKILTTAYIKTVDDLLDRFDKIHGPNWTARNDFAKIIITLSSGILALTVSISSGLFAKGYQQSMTNYFLTELVFLIFSIFSCVVSIYLCMRITMLRIQFENQRTKFIENTLVLEKQGVSMPEFFKQVLFERFDKTFKLDMLAGWLLHVGLISFGLSMFVLFLIGWESFSNKACSGPKFSSANAEIYSCYSSFNSQERFPNLAPLSSCSNASADVICCLQV